MHGVVCGCVQWLCIVFAAASLQLRGVAGQVYTCWDFTLTNGIMDWTTISGSPVNRQTYSSPNSDGDGIGILTPDYGGSPYPQARGGGECCLCVCVCVCVCVFMCSVTPVVCLFVH